MKRYLWLVQLVGLFLLLLAGVVAGFKMKPKAKAAELDEHYHGWGMWSQPSNSVENNIAVFAQFRSCTNCGLSEYRCVNKVD